MDCDNIVGHILSQTVALYKIIVSLKIVVGVNGRNTRCVVNFFKLIQFKIRDIG